MNVKMLEEWLTRVAAWFGWTSDGGGGDESYSTVDTGDEEDEGLVSIIAAGMIASHDSALTLDP